jgi:hypothetical protein
VKRVMFVMLPLHPAPRMYNLIHSSHERANPSRGGDAKPTGLLAKLERRPGYRKEQRRGMSRKDGLRILFANEPRTYRQAMAGAIEKLRPQDEVVVAKPEQLDEQVERLRPHVVICSRVSPTVRRIAHSWVELYPNHGELSYVSVGGEVSEVSGLDFEALLSVLHLTVAALARTTAGAAPLGPESPADPSSQEEGIWTVP